MKHPKHKHRSIRRFSLHERVIRERMLDMPSDDFMRKMMALCIASSNLYLCRAMGGPHHEFIQYHAVWCGHVVDFLKMQEGHVNA